MQTLTNEDQLALVEGARKGDAQAYESLYALCSRPLARMFSRMVPADADDLVQDTMVRAFARLDQFDGESAFVTWVVAVGRNLALMRLRKNKREAEVIIGSTDDRLTNDNGDTYRVAEQGYDDRTFDKQEAFLLVHEAMATLGDMERQALQLRFDGNTMEEIQAELGFRTLSATKTSVYRARLKVEAYIKTKNGAPAKPARLCKCGCGGVLPQRGYPYLPGHGKRQKYIDEFAAVA